MFEELVDPLLASCSDHVEGDGLRREDRGARDLDLNVRLRPLSGLEPALCQLGEKPVGGRVDLACSGFEALPELFVDADVLADRPGHGSGSLHKLHKRSIFGQAEHIRDAESCSPRPKRLVVCGTLEVGMEFSVEQCEGLRRKAGRPSRQVCALASAMRRS